MIVLLPTSGTGSRLQRATQHTNKSLVPLGDKLAICRIIELYPVDTTFVVTIGHCGNLVREFLTLAYPNHTFLFVEVDNYSGPGSSLGYSILQARQHLQCPFVFHCCDTILTAPAPDAGNVMLVAENTDPVSYSSVDVQDDGVTCVYMKGHHGHYAYVGVSRIENWREFWEALDAEPRTSSLSDVHALAAMVNRGIYVSFKVVDFHDTGNVGSYAKAKITYPSSYDILEKNDESLCFFPDRVIKFCADDVTNRKRVARARYIPGAPAILQSTPHFMVMEFVRGEVASEVTTYGTVRNLLAWANQNLWVDPTTRPEFRNTCRMFYRTKTLERIQKLTVVDKEVVNGLRVGSLAELLQRVDFQSLETDTFYRFHGDFILDNVLQTPTTFVLLDWRHEFGDQLDYGDKYYDLAKLRHNIIFNHKNITNGLFTIHEGQNVFVDLKCNYMLVRQLEEFDAFVRENHLDERKIQLLMCLIWLNMAPLYTGRLQSFLYFFAKFNLFLQLRP